MEATPVHHVMSASNRRLWVYHLIKIITIL